MHKHIAFGVGLLMAFSPLIVLAQTTNTSSNTSLIAALTALVQQLEQELLQLIAVKSSPTTAQSQNTASVPSNTQQSSACTTFANLKKGDTDATTGGEVSQLQSFLGISPPTGYYGAQTSIGYQNKCGNLGNSQPTSVAGMSEYTDSDFGFSFWYPNSWTVEKNRVALGGSGSQVLIRNTSGFVFDINEVTGSEITNSGHGVPEEKYYFDQNTGAWTHGVYSESTNINAADLSNNTMGGLHMFSWDSVKSDCEVVVPLSATKFLDVTDNSCELNVNPLVQTIIATNPNVATPVSTAQQIATIQAEANAYGVSMSNTTQPSSLQTYTNSQYGFSVQYDPSSFTTASPSVMPFMGYANVNDMLFMLYYTGGKNIAGFDGASMAFGASNAVTYEDCTRMLSGSESDAVQSTTKQITINGNIFYEDSTGDAATGHYSSTNSYRTYYNGACYEAFMQIDTSRTADGTPAGDVTSVSNALQTVLDSLTFTTPDTAPALHASTSQTWGTFVGQQTPTSFTYPGSFLVYESEDESDIGPGEKAGLQSFQSTTDPGAIAVQMTPSKYFPVGDSAAQAMQASMKTEPIAYPSFSYTSMTLGGETAYEATEKSGTSVIYVAHGSNFFRILLWGPLLSQEYQNFVSSFRFTQ